jgi:hypothetical protein
MTRKRRARRPPMVVLPQLRALDPAVCLARDGIELLAFDAGRGRAGLVVTVEARRGDAAAVVLRAVQLADPQDRAAFAAEVAGADDAAAAIVVGLLLELVPAVEGALRTHKRRAAVDAEYHATADGLFLTRPGRAPSRLTNFDAKIVTEVIADDGSGELRRLFDVEAQLHGRAYRFLVPAAQFGGLGWMADHLGAGAIAFPGEGRAHAGVAIQALSGDAPQRRVFAHTGWRTLDDGCRVYLHASGAIGADGVVPDVEVQLPNELAEYVLPPPPAGAERTAAVRASLALADLAPPSVAVPPLAAAYRAALGSTDFSLHITGETGMFKTAFVALHQQHYGAALDERHLPASWRSTANAIEALAYAAQDALLTVDDFAPSGDAYAVARWHREADSLLRAQGNRAGRQRMRADATLRPHRPPRGLLMSTGEDVPRGQSLRARLLVVEVVAGDIDVSQLGACQRAGADGTYARALSAFVQWTARHADEVWRHRADVVAQLREAAAASGRHRRTPAIVAELAWAWWILLSFSVDVGAVTIPEAATRWEAGWQALGAVAAAQVRWQAASEPTLRFLELLVAAVASGRAHVAAPDGGPPLEPAGWGWRYEGGGDHAEWRARVDRIGWLEEADLYLEPEAAYAAVQRLARDGGDALGLTSATLRRRLRDRRLLASADEKRQTLTIRKTVEGRRREVLHLHADALATAADTAVVTGTSAGGAGGWNGSGPSQADISNPTNGQPMDSDTSLPLVGLVGKIEGRQREPGDDDVEPTGGGKA